jgi:hypothetical protein
MVILMCYVQQLRNLLIDNYIFSFERKQIVRVLFQHLCYLTRE